MRIIIISLALSFCWVEFIHQRTSQILQIITGSNILQRKPFNCVKCLTGWVSLIIGVYLHGIEGVIYLPLGLFTGAIFSTIQMRYL
jgi:hypothetical protein